MTGDPEALERAAARLAALADPEARGFRVWGLWGRALTDSLRGDHEEAERLAANALESARELGLEPLVWRSLLLRARSLEALGRLEEAQAAADEAGRILREMSVGIEDEELRDSFLGRPDVATHLRGEASPRRGQQPD